MQLQQQQPGFLLPLHHVLLHTVRLQPPDSMLRCFLQAKSTRMQWPAMLQVLHLALLQQNLQVSGLPSLLHQRWLRAITSTMHSLALGPGLLHTWQLKLQDSMLDSPLPQRQL